MLSVFRREPEDDRTPETCECPKARAIDLLAKIRPTVSSHSGKWWVYGHLVINGMDLKYEGEHTNLETAISMCHVKWLEAKKMGAK